MFLGSEGIPYFFFKKEYKCPMTSDTLARNNDTGQWGIVSRVILFCLLCLF
jgi:hypothetical protein